jgi:hypothetical protein
MRRIRFVGVRMVLFGIVAVGLMGLVIFGLWNLLMPAIFSLPAITFWQALGLFLLSRLLFGRFGGWGHRMRKARFVRGWKDLTHEERDRFSRAMGTCRPRNPAEGDAAQEV